MSMSAARADDTLEATFGGGVYVWLHTGDPGADGTANVAEVDSDPIDRKAVTFGSPENHPENIERRVLSDSEVVWTGEEIDAAQTITHFSIWSAEIGGQVEHIAELDEAAVVGSDGVTIPAGAIEAAIEVYAKPTA